MLGFVPQPNLQFRARKVVRALALDWGRAQCWVSCLNPPTIQGKESSKGFSPGLGTSPMLGFVPQPNLQLRARFVVMLVKTYDRILTGLTKTFPLSPKRATKNLSMSTNQRWGKIGKVPYYYGVQLRLISTLIKKTTQVKHP